MFWPINEAGLTPDEVREHAEAGLRLYWQFTGRRLVVTPSFYAVLMAKGIDPALVEECQLLPIGEP